VGDLSHGKDRRDIQDTETHRQAHALANTMEHLERYFQHWRFGLVRTSEGVIGLKRRKQGTSGAKYLRRIRAVGLFPEPRHLRSKLQARQRR
jgi:tryptophan 2,3-dioxygenase